VIFLPESLKDVIKRYLEPYGGASSIEVEEERVVIDGKKYWSARIIVEGLPNATTCERLGKYLAKKTRAELRFTPIFVSPTGIKPSSCWIEIKR